ncbi:unnamed protein product [Schistocephalus solidus]|uniref:Reverse transcriptase domain-containing protein n=1 Tax=Schistocephalus solidus TaxID=70667 RepID=A0A183TRK3_SCHSO|nr:unnamed protein product [Schistocephalus solidus]
MWHSNVLVEGSEKTAVSSMHFLEKLRGITKTPDEIMVSFDVVSLFTSIPKELVTIVIDDLLDRMYNNEGKLIKRLPGQLLRMTDKRLSSPMHEQTFAVRRNDIQTHVAMHSLENNHWFDLNVAQALGRVENCLAREVNEAWQTEANSINRSIDLPVPYEAIKHHWRTRGGPMRKEAAIPTASEPEKSFLNHVVHPLL